MENEHPQNITYNFLADRQLGSLFSKIDYTLRSGMHIQREHPRPEEIFRFVERHHESLTDYYRDIFKLSLESGGEAYQNRYYYLDFEAENNRSMIPGNNRFKRYMDTAHIIIGMLFLKMYKLDANIELNSVEGFITLLFSEYEEEKNGLYRLIARAKSDKTTDYLENDVIREITNAFDEFSKMGWILWEDDEHKRFKYLPSFERLRKKYEMQILGINEIIEQYEREK
jgi:hypothetical protein